MDVLMWNIYFKNCVFYQFSHNLLFQPLLLFLEYMHVVPYLGKFIMVGIENDKQPQS